MKKKASKIIFENIELALGRAKQADLREEPFQLLRRHMLDSIAEAFSEEDILKVVLIQRNARKWLNMRLQIELDRVLNMGGSEGSESETDDRVGEGDANGDSESIKVVEQAVTIPAAAKELQPNEVNDEVLLTSIRRRNEADAKRLNSQPVDAETAEK